MSHTILTHHITWAPGRPCTGPATLEAYEKLFFPYFCPRMTANQLQ